MKLLMIGQSVEDHISTNGKITLKPGGVYYSAAALVNIANDDDEIYLCTTVEKGKEELFSPVYNKLNKKFFNYKGVIPVVHLTIHNDKERDERYENLNSSLSIDLSILKDVDAVYVNMVTGFDITINDMERIRKNFKGTIYIDIHTLSRGYDEHGKREFRFIPEAERWLRSADIVQVNESELMTLSRKLNREEIIKDVLESGPLYLIITMGDKGAGIFYKGNNQISSKIISSIKINTLNNVGCGDVFGAVYFYYYTRDKSFFEALKNANIAAGLSASYSSFDEFIKLKNDVFSRYN